MATKNITIVKLRDIPLPDGYHWSRSNGGAWEVYSDDTEDSGPYPIMILDGAIILVG